MADGIERSRGAVDVYGDNLFTPPLLSSHDISKIVVRDSDGSPAMFLQRMVDDTWAWCHRGDPDWEDSKARYGVR